MRTPLQRKAAMTAWRVRGHKSVVPRRYAHLVYGLLQSALTSAVAAAIATMRAPHPALVPWLASWLMTWATILPIVVLAAPAIRTLCDVLTREESA